ncbi:MAG: methyltransferase domain-containing protein [Myxococcota bacterium]
MGLYAERVFPWLVSTLEGPKLRALIARVVAGAQGDVLEVGFGMGKTLAHYGDAVRRLTVLEPSEAMNRRTAPLLAAAPFETSVVQARGEAMPFSDDRFDAAVCTLTLCSVDDPAAVLRELTRVLKPGGALHFLEHVRSEDPRVARKQRLLDPLQRRIGCGCELSRDTGGALVRAGFELVAVERKVGAALPLLDLRLFPILFGEARAPG